MPHGYNPFIRRQSDAWLCMRCLYLNDDEDDRCCDCGRQRGSDDEPDDGEQDEAA